MSVLQDQASRGDGRIPTSLVGSYAQPNWLIDRERLRGRFPPRVRATELWRVDPGYLEEAQDMQARPDAARQYRVDVLNEATSGVNGTVAVHICFGYAAIIHQRPSGYSFLAELAGTECNQVSIETAQSGLELEVLEALGGKTIILGVLDLSTDEVEAGATVNHRIRRAFPYVRAERLVAAPDCGMKYLPRGVAYGKLEALVQGAGLASQPA